jgi:hypothetical protein|tara:strand:- start:54 stop:353 length:300 start_codon:yes stop_codon:yes gene_type:complete
MFERAKKFLLDYSNHPAKYDYPDWSVDDISQELDNVWAWLPDDISQWTIIRSPYQPMPQAEAIWIMYENWNHERVAHTWFCETSAELDKAMQEIKTKFL